MAVKDHSISGEVFELWKCNDCSFVFTQEPPVEEECGPYYISEDYISHSDKKEGIRDRLYHMGRDYMLGRKAKIIGKHLGKSFKGKLLDVGSGTGYFLNFMKTAGWEVQGIEVNHKARLFSEKHFGIQSLPPIELFKLQDMFSAITLWHVLEHLYDFHKYLEKFKSLLKPNGILVIAVPNHTSKDAAFYQAHWGAYDVPRHLWHFQPSDLDFIANKHGLKLKAKYGMPLDAFYVAMLSEQYKKGLPLITGGIQGMLSNFSAFTDVNRSSSIIYIFTK